MAEHLAGRKRLWVEAARYPIKFCIVQFSAGACLLAYRILIAHCVFLGLSSWTKNEHAGDTSKPL
jgi:hypothetical protein